MTVSNTTPVPETTPIYIGTDGGGPGTSFSTANFKFFKKFSCTYRAPLNVRENALVEPNEQFNAHEINFYCRT